MPSPASDVMQVNALLHGYENGISIAPSYQGKQKLEGAFGDHRRNMAMSPRKHQTTDDMLIKAVSDGDKNILIFRSRKPSYIVHRLGKAECQVRRVRAYRPDLQASR